MSSMELEGFEFEGEYEGEGEFEGFELEGEGEFESHEYEMGEMEGFLPGLGNIIGGLLGGGELPSPLSEQQENELASELLEVGNEYELEQFLGKLISGAVRGVKSFARSGVGRALGGVLKNVAKTALPVVGGALGSFVAPGVGTMIGKQLGSLASRALEFEGEVSSEELEFEVARRVVRIGATAAAQAARAPRSAPPAAVARRAVVRATRMHAPAAARSLPRGGRAGGRQMPAFRDRRPARGQGWGPSRPSRRRYRGGYGEPTPYPSEPSWYGSNRGEWIRRGNRIILLDV